MQISYGAFSPGLITYVQRICPLTNRWVGTLVRIRTPNGEAPPLITGTFGSADFMHSMLGEIFALVVTTHVTRTYSSHSGEATDHISQSSVTDLSQKMSNVKPILISLSCLLDLMTPLHVVRRHKILTGAATSRLSRTSFLNFPSEEKQPTQARPKT